MCSAYFPDMTSAEVDRHSAAEGALFLDIARSQLRPIPGTLEFLKRVEEAAIPKCLVTNAPRHARLRRFSFR